MTYSEPQQPPQFFHLLSFKGWTNTEEQNMVRKVASTTTEPQQGLCLKEKLAPGQSHARSDCASLREWQPPTPQTVVYSRSYISLESNYFTQKGKKR